MRYISSLDSTLLGRQTGVQVSLPVGLSLTAVGVIMPHRGPDHEERIWRTCFGSILATGCSHQFPRRRSGRVLHVVPENPCIQLGDIMLNGKDFRFAGIFSGLTTVVIGPFLNATLYSGVNTYFYLYILCGSLSLMAILAPFHTKPNQGSVTYPPNQKGR